jgi:hypothetical protein
VFKVCLDMTGDHAGDEVGGEGRAIHYQILGLGADSPCSNHWLWQVMLLVFIEES